MTIPETRELEAYWAGYEDAMRATWSGGGLRCTSALPRLTCRNRRGHGVFLGSERWRAF
jgi:hypothetical protein